MEDVNFLAYRPEYWYSPNNKVANVVFNHVKNNLNGDINHDCYLSEGKEIDLTSHRDMKANRKIILLVNLYSDKVDIEGNKEISTFDREVHDAVITLFKNNLECMSTKMVIRTMFANQKMSVHSSILEAVTNSLKKMMTTTITFDTSQEAQVRNFDEFKIDMSLLPAEWISAKINGQKVNALKLLNEPPLLKYAECTNQILRIDMKLLNSPLENTVENLLLRNYVLRQILIISSQKNHRSNSMLFQTILNFLGVNLANCESKQQFIKKKSMLKAKIKELLDFWKGEDLFKDFAFKKNGNQLRSIVISTEKTAKKKNIKEF